MSRPINRLIAKHSSGYSMIEMLITISILAVLASMAMPKYADTLLKSKQGALKGNLGSLRSALELYYSDNGGISPSCAVGPNSTVFKDVLLPKYIPNIPNVENGLHPPTNAVYCDFALVAGSVHDGQGWYYDGAAPSDSNFGSLWVACDHTDTKGSSWTSY